MADLAPVRETAQGVLRIAVKLTPKASRNRVQGMETDAGGQPRLKVMVTAVPEAGKANAALMKLLAKVWKIPASSLTIAAGHQSRLKELEYCGDAQPVLDWFGALGHEKTKNDKTKNDSVQEDL